MITFNKSVNGNNNYPPRIGVCIVFVLIFLLHGTVAYSQLEGTSFEDRLGGKGTKLYKINSGLNNRFVEFYKRFEEIVNNSSVGEERSAGSFELNFDKWPCDSVYECWRRFYDAAPYSYKNVYVYGATMLDSMSLHAKVSEAERLLYFQDLMQIYEDRIRRLDTLNSIYSSDAEARYRSTKLGVMLNAAVVYWHTAPRVKGSGYTEEKAYQNFVNAFKQSSGIADEEVRPVFLEYYFAACRDLYESDKEKYMEQFLTDYTACLDACDKMMSAYADGKDSVQWMYYAGARTNIEIYFKRSGVATVENMEKFYSSRLDSIKDDYPALKNAVHLMMTSNDSLLSSNVFYKACRYSYKLHPDFENCIGMALIEKDQMENRDGAMDYFHEAEELASTPYEKFIASARIAMGLMSELRPSPNTMQGEWEALSVAERNDLIREWQSRQNVAARKLDEAIGYGLEAGINGQNLVPLYLSMAQAYRRSEDAGTINLASQALDQILSLYPAFPQNRIDDERKNIENVKANLAKRAAVEEQYKKNKAAYEKWQKQQAEIARKRKEEEDFWSGGKK